MSQDEISYSLPAKAQSAVHDMVGVIRLCSQEKENLRVSDIYDQLLVKSGYLKALEAEDTPEAESRIENLLDFKSFIYDYEKEKADAGEKATLEAFLEKVATDGDADKMEEGTGKVTLMTMHSAKGLEFPVVFLPGLEDGLFPGHRAMDNESGMEEERRLCYVGMTRAREKLILTGAAYRVLYGRGEYTRESTFLRELDKSLLDAAGDTVFTASRRTNNHLGVDTGSRTVSASRRSGRILPMIRSNTRSRRSGKTRAAAAKTLRSAIRCAMASSVRDWCLRSTIKQLRSCLTASAQKARQGRSADRENMTARIGAADTPYQQNPRGGSLPCPDCSRPAEYRRFHTWNRTRK